MSEDARSVSSRVEVSVDPDAAFTAFTDELDLWWVRGPINHFDGGRTRAVRCERGVGGRLLEVYDDDVLELGRITVWEPGARLSWTSSLDDVEVDVRFTGDGSSTVVEVTARLPRDGVDRGGTAWVRVVPRWFGAWCARRDHDPHEVRDLARLALAVYYDKPAAAARWLAATFGFESSVRIPEGPDPLPHGEHGHPWIEFRLGDSSLMVFPAGDAAAAPRTREVPWVYVDDVVAHYERSVAAGATIVEALASPWGLPFYVAEDLEQRRWTFLQARPTMR